MAIKTISFDFWGTLADGNKEYKKLRNQYLAEISSKNVDEVKQFLDDMKNDYDGVVEVTGTSFDIFMIYSKICRRFGIVDTDVDSVQMAVEQIFLANLPILKDDTISVLQKLKQDGYEIFIASNTLFVSGDIMIQALVAMDLHKYFTAFFYSDRIGVSKPHTAFFSTMHETSNSLRSEFIHVGDNMRTDVCGAHEYGMKAYEISNVYYTTLTTFYNDLKAEKF
jgi:HAD superfamily hydrolase (TIGR01549 family)